MTATKKMNEGERREALLAMQRNRSQKANEARTARRLRENAVAGIMPPDWSNLPVGEGFCSLRTPQCSDAYDYKKIRRACCVALNFGVLKYVTELLTALEIPWFADYGTLLGAVRHGGMIPWDKDSDLGIFETDKRKILQLEQQIRRLGVGFSGSMRGTIKFSASGTNRTHTDLFAWHLNARGKWDRKQWADVDRFKGRQMPENWLLPFTQVPYAGPDGESILLNAPAALRFPGKLPAPQYGLPEGSAFLEHRYPPDWREPVRANNAGQVVA